MYLGRFPFHMGPAQVLIRNLSSGPGSSLSIDAVRFGGGMGRIERGTGSYPASGPTTGRARWESCARYHAQFQGAPESVYNSSSGNDSKDDVGARARYAAWQHEEGEDAVFVSWHTNAPNPARGTSTWVYGPNEPNGQYIFTGTEGSDALAAAVHEEIINAIRSEWDPEWKDRGIKSAWFGELNPNSNPEMPATLVEMAFHDTEADAIYLAEPRFRKTLAHAYYRGIVRYFAERDGIPAQYLPEPPMHVGAYGDVDGTVEVVWSPSDAGVASSAYRVWTSYDGHGFSVAAVTTTPSVRLEDLPQGVPLFVRVTATNEGGESFPSATLAVLPSCNSSEERALIVQGFTRLDRQSLPTVDLSPFSLGTVMRLEQEVVNTFDYAIEHAQALATLGIPFDAVEASVVESGQVALASYGAVDWILGEESTLDETFNETEQQHVADYLDGGGKLLVSGAEIAWDLDAQGSESDRNFCAQYLKVLLGQDDAGTQSLDTGVAFSSSYHVDFPDAFVPQDNATLLWEYSTGTVAAVSWTGAFSVVTVGFPLESVGDLDARSTLMSDAMQALGFDSATQHCTEPPPPPADEHSPAAEAGPDTGAAGQDTVARAPNIGGGVVTVRGGQHRQAEGGCTYGHGSSPYGLLFVTLLALVVLAGGRRWEPT
jgi:hypothetical protein